MSNKDVYKNHITTYFGKNDIINVVEGFTIEDSSLNRIKLKRVADMVATRTFQLKSFCPYTSILDGMSQCSWQSAELNNESLESGNMNFIIRCSRWIDSLCQRSLAIL
jgi:hypothetical protein